MKKIFILNPKEVLALLPVAGLSYTLVLKNGVVVEGVDPGVASVYWTENFSKLENTVVSKIE